MCRRVLLMAAAGAVLATYQGVEYRKISVDARCILPDGENGDSPNRSYSAPLNNDVLSFANSDKAGVMVVDPADKIKTTEFTDSVPDDALIIEYVEPEETGE